MSNYKLFQSSPILQSETKSGLPKFWRGHILLDGNTYYLQSESWSMLTDGTESKHNESIPYEVSVKNVGKKNETTPYEQAVSEFESMVKSQKDKKNYAPLGAKVSVDKLPMPQLAHKYRDHSKKIVYPCFVQPKLDGNRGIASSTKMQTRGGQPFIPEVVQHFMFEHDDIILDGEVILPDMPPLQTTMRVIKKVCDLSPTLIYWVYDIVDDQPQFTRLETLKKLESSFPPNVKLVETTLVHNEAELQAKHEQYVLEGYEGTIVRNYEGLYEVGHRSYDLQKKKDFEEAEFKVVGCKSGGGLYEGCAIFRCVTDKGEEFDSNPEGTLETKRQYYKDRDSYIGKYLTIRFFSKSLSGKPGFNVGVAFREQGEF